MGMCHGTVGIANVVVIGVLERRGEIGLRRALSATRGHISAQFLVESLVVSNTGTIADLVFGGAATLGYAAVRE